MLQGVPITLAARRVPLDRYVTDFGDRDTDSGGQAVGFMIYGNPNSEVRQARQAGQAREEQGR